MIQTLKSSRGWRGMLRLQGAIATLSACVSMLPAQVFTVGGVGAAFPDIATAVANVPSGAILDVRPGNYAPFTIDQKSLTVLGGPGVQISSIVATVRVQNLAAGQQVTLRGLHFWSTIANSRIWITDNQGRVVLDGITANNVGVGLSVLDSRDVRVRKGSFGPFGPSAPPVYIGASNVRLTSCSLTGSGLPSAMQVASGTVDLTDCTAAASIWSPTISMDSSNLTLRGASSLQSANFAAIDGSGSVRIDPSVQLISGASPPIDAAIATTTRALPAVRATVGDPGQTTTAILSGPAGGYGWLLAGVPGPRTPILLPTGAATDALDLLPASQILMADGAFPGAVSGSYTSPTLPALIGVQITWQAVSIDASSGLQISNGVTFAHR